MNGLRVRSFPLVLLVALCLLLAGCLDIQIRFVVHSDGSGFVTWNFEIPPETAALGFTAARLKAELLKDNQFRRPDVQLHEGNAGSGNQTLTVTVPFQNLSQISSGDFQAAFAVLPDRKKCSFRFKGNNDPLQASMARIKMDVEMPGKITSSNADQVAGNVAHFATVFRAEPLYVEAETSGFTFGDPRIIAGCAALGALVLMVVWVLRRGREKGLAPAAGTQSAGSTVGSTPATSADQTARIYCGDCGAQNRSSSKFCHRCGVEL